MVDETASSASMAQADQSMDDEPDRAKVKRHIELWDERVRAAREDERQHYGNLRRWRSIVAGIATGADPEFTEEGLVSGRQERVRAAIIFSTFQALIPYLYAQDPEASVSPTQAVTATAYELIRRFATTCEIVLARTFEDASLKRMGKRQLRSAMTGGIGWLKGMYQRDYDDDPLMLNRENDSQDNIANLRGKQSELTDERSPGGETEGRVAELEAQVEAIQQRTEVVVAEGFVLDRVLDDHITVCPSVRELEDYLQAPWIDQEIRIPVEDARALFPDLTERDFAKAKSTPYTSDFAGEQGADTTEQSQRDTPAITSTGKDSRMAVIAHETWCKRDLHVYTWLEGLDKWARQPYVPKRQGKRWYPFFALILNPIDARRRPLSDVELLATLEEEYNDTREKFARHRLATVPSRIGRSGDISPKDADKIKNAEANELVLVDGPDDNNAPLQNSLAQTPQAAIDPMLYDTGPIRADFDLVSGVGDANRGAVVNPKTATEAGYLQAGMMSRTGERRDAIETLYGELARYTIEVLLQEMTLQQVQRIAGFGAEWPELSKEEVFDLVKIEVKVGSSGPPNEEIERDQWLQFLPTLLGMIEKVGVLRQQQMNAIADAYVEAMKETLRRFDDRMDVERFLPGGPDDPLMVGTSAMDAQGQNPEAGMQPAPMAGAQPEGLAMLAMQAPPPADVVTH